MKDPYRPKSTPINSGVERNWLLLIASIITKRMLDTACTAATGPLGPVAYAFWILTMPTVFIKLPIRPSQNIF